MRLKNQLNQEVELYSHEVTGEQKNNRKPTRMSKYYLSQAKIYLISSASTISRRQVIDKISGDIKNWNQL